MSDNQADHFERFRAVYREHQASRAKMERAARWIIDRYAPYRPGEIVRVPSKPPTMEAGKMMEVRSVAIDCEPATGRIYWAISGDVGHFRVPLGANTPEPMISEQKDLF